MHIGKDLTAASAAPLALGVLAEGDSYGYAILKRISELSEGQIEWSEGLLYPLLHRLERLGHIEAYWSKGETGRRRKYYAITKDGRSALIAHREQWQAVHSAQVSLWGNLRIELAAIAGSMASAAHEPSPAKTRLCVSQQRKHNAMPDGATMAHRAAMSCSALQRTESLGVFA